PATDEGAHAVNNWTGDLASGTRHSCARAWLADARNVDDAVYASIARTPTPDRAMSALSHAANYSRLWIASAAALALLGGRPGRRAAGQGLVSVATTSAMVNLAVKRVGRRQRPDRAGMEVPTAS